MGELSSVHIRAILLGCYISDMDYCSIKVFYHNWPVCVVVFQDIISRARSTSAKPTQILILLVASIITCVCQLTYSTFKAKLPNDIYSGEKNVWYHKMKISEMNSVECCCLPSFAISHCVRQGQLDDSWLVTKQQKHFNAFQGCHSGNASSSSFSVLRWRLRQPTFLDTPGQVSGN